MPKDLPTVIHLVYSRTLLAGAPRLIDHATRLALTAINVNLQPYLVGLRGVVQTMSHAAWLELHCATPRGRFVSGDSPLISPICCIIDGLNPSHYQRLEGLKQVFRSRTLAEASSLEVFLPSDESSLAMRCSRLGAQLRDVVCS